MATMVEKAYGDQKLPSLSSPTPRSVSRSSAGSAKSNVSLPKLVLKAYGTSYSTSVKKRNHDKRRKSLTKSGKVKLPKIETAKKGMKNI